MPTPDEIRSVVGSYVKMMCESDIDGILALYADDATAEDPAGGQIQKGKEALRNFYTLTAPALQVELNGPVCVAGRECAFLVLAELTMGDAKQYLDATDVFTFNDEGKITSMRAFWNPAELRPGALMEDLTGKVVFVTGGASGIGLALAEGFAKEGAKIVLADIEAEALKKAEGDLLASGAEVIGVQCDVSNHASVAAAADRAIEAFGKVHVLCNNAGVAPSGEIDQTTPDDWKWCVGVNLMGVVHGIQVLVPRIKEHGEGGHVVNTASVAGLMALPTLGIYSATKYAVVGISETLRGELAPVGIGVSVICPSFVKTRLHEGHRNRPPELGSGPEEPNEFMTQMLAIATEPHVIAERVIRGVKRGDFYILPHADMKAGVEARANEILAAFDLD